MKPTIDLQACTGCGTCEAICPEVFQVQDDGFAHVLIEEPGPDVAVCVDEAAASCPSEAISLD